MRRRKNPVENEVNWTPIILVGAGAIGLYVIWEFYQAIQKNPPTACSNAGSALSTEVGGAVLGQSLASCGENADYAAYGLTGTFAATINTLLFNLPATIGGWLANAAADVGCTYNPNTPSMTGQTAQSTCQGCC